MKVSKVEASDSRDMHDENISNVDNGDVMSTSQHRLIVYSVWDSHVFILITMKQICLAKTTGKLGIFCHLAKTALTLVTNRIK